MGEGSLCVDPIFPPMADYYYYMCIYTYTHIIDNIYNIINTIPKYTHHHYYYHQYYHYYHYHH